MKKGPQLPVPAPSVRGLCVGLFLALLVLVVIAAGLASADEGLELANATYSALDIDADGLNDTAEVVATIHNANTSRSWVFALELGLYLDAARVDLASSNGRLDPNETANITLRASTDTGSGTGLYVVKASLHETSLSGPVRGEDQVSMDLHPLGDYRLDLRADRTSWETGENSTVTFVLTVTSLSNNPTEVELHVDTTLGWPYGLDPTTVLLDPDGSKRVELSVQVPPDTPPGSRESIGVDAVAARNRTAFATVDLSVTVERQVYDVALELDETRVLLASGQTAHVGGSVVNLGNNRDNVTLLVGPPPGWDAVFEPSFLLLGSGSSGSFTLHLTASEASGSAGIIELNVTARSQGLVEEDSVVLVVVFNRAELSIDGGNVTISPNTPAAGELVTLQAGVRNEGSIGVEDVEMAILTDEGEAARTTVPVVAAGGLGVATLTWTPSPGSNLLRLVVDPDDRVAETNETDNVHTLTLLVVSPDLSVTATDIGLEPAYPAEGSEATVRVVVRNVDQLPTGAFKVVVEVDDALVETFSVTDGLVGGANRTLDATWAAVGGRHTITVEVDPDGDVLEENRNNNVASRRFSVNRRPVANLTLASGTVLVDETLDLDGSLSSDPDGRIRQWFFDYGDGTDSGWVFTSSISHTYSEPGQYQVRLFVRDEAGAQCAEAQAVTVEVRARSTDDGPTPGPVAMAALAALAAVASGLAVLRGRPRCGG